MNQADQERLAWERFKATAKQRKDFKRAREAGHTVVADTREQLVARARRLVRLGEVDPDALVRAMEQPSDGRALERIIESADLQKVNFLGRGADAARAVARVMIRQGRATAGFGTAFLVGRRLVLTNNHVLPDVATASGSLLEFDFEDGPDGLAKPVVRFELDPATLFLTDEGLDYTLVAVRPDGEGRAAGALYGWNVLIAQQGKIVTGEPVNVVGHPDGRPKEIAIRENQLVNQLPDFLHYRTDTQPGNSGSPVFNDQWEVVALHHSGVRDPAGGPDDWIANEGARISRVMEDLRAKATGPAQQAVLAELGAAADPVPLVRTPEAVITAAPAVVRPSPGRSRGPSRRAPGR
ncbi:trypsin-like serine peptidase [Pseudonocardia pini]|uniref:trypsin-like serine peptidase n=1 Tax=Pseudonocardia pini TaxID=2758030 RepID=UPI0015F0DBB8|nr:serine protease [Pseudonocardia pini]